MLELEQASASPERGEPAVRALSPGRGARLLAAAQERGAAWVAALRAGRPPAERSRRMIVLLCAIWLLNVVDLTLTLSESRRHLFVELNPVARWVLGLPPAALVVYKTTLVAAGSWILLGCARHRVAELACWLLLAVYVNVTLQWSMYYFHFLQSLADPAVNFDPWTGALAP